MIEQADQKRRLWLDQLELVYTPLLLILTAWGNAIVMLVVASIGLLAGVWMLRRKDSRSATVAGVMGCAIAIVIALIWLFR
ncbi:MAG: hypothetical protein L0Z50_01575 [Verrucomicrobiales bacterium]|nr:hypothetical protein [Verrucomicrobiales bacterium]